ncbi:MAG TPA: LuxR C-terminal-related transcriptional regulator, partial [Frankiaceae bacterium]|nr:LuxR C-terminal-related transcriptional regulator [Frankiaceae bacterium]
SSEQTSARLVLSNVEDNARACAVTGDSSAEHSARAPAPDDVPVARAGLTSWFHGLSGSSVVLVTAPAGYGKTTLLQQWAAGQGRPVARLTLDRSSNDPVVLLAYLATALGPSGQLNLGLFSGPLSDPAFFETVVLPRFGRALRAREDPFLLLVDDVQEVSATRSWSVLSTVISCLPERSLLVLAGRAEPPPLLARSAGRRPIARVGPAELAFSPAEGAELLRGMDVKLSSEDGAALQAKSEGWPAALYLAGLSLQGHPDPPAAVAEFSGSSGVMSDYLRDEFLARSTAEVGQLLRRTAILGDVSGPLCDAVLGTAGSATLLAQISRTNLLLEPKSDEPGWYRYHQLLSDLLRAELHRLEPEIESELHARASRWFEANSRVSPAIAHARAAGDAARAAELVWAETPRLLATGHRGTVERWLEDFSRSDLVADPLLALANAWCAMSSGEPVDPWLVTAELALRKGDRQVTAAVSAAGSVALLRGSLAADGARQMTVDGELAHDLDAEDSPGRVVACYLAGVGHHLTGDAETSMRWLEKGRELGRRFPMPTVWALCTAQLGLVTALEGDWQRTVPLVDEAMEIVRRFEVQDYATMAPVFAMSALSMAHTRRHAEARSAAAHAMVLLDRVIHIAPWMAVEVRAVLARAHLLLGEPGIASTLTREADERLPATPDAPALERQLDEVRSLTRTAIDGGRAGSPTLTGAEQRVVRLLPTHLSFVEIAEELYISKNTVKTQAISAYRKLGVNSRSAAVERIRAWGLGGS